jgi:hypothetical protein
MTATDPACVVAGCKRPAEWVMCSYTSGGDLMTTHHACADTFHAGQATARARQDANEGKVTVRPMVDIYASRRRATE